MDDDMLEKYFEICRRVHEQMQRDGTWPWGADSREFEDMIDSEDTLNDV